MNEFLDLPIIFDEIETSKDGWRRTVKRQGSIRELLTIWNIDDEDDLSAMVQVLRHLRDVMVKYDFKDDPVIGWKIIGVHKDESMLCEASNGARRRYSLGNH